MDSDSDSDKTKFARFLVISPVDDQLNKLSPFAINKGIHVYCLTKNIKKLKSGQYLVEVDKENHSRHLLAATKIVEAPVTVSPHRTLNTKRGVVRCIELKHCSDEEVKRELAPQGVADVRRITVMRDGQRQLTGTFILTFDQPNLPASIKVGYLNVRVNLYVPNPVRCFKCQRFGHFVSNCQQNARCCKCGKEDHDQAECNNEPSCTNCSGPHPANHKSCPKWSEEKEIQKLKCERNIPYPEAKRLLFVSGPRGQSYAQAAAPKPKATIATQTDLTSADIDNLMKNKKPTVQNTIQNTQTTSRASQNSGTRVSINRSSLSLIQSIKDRKSSNKPPTAGRSLSQSRTATQRSQSANRFSALSDDDMDTDQANQVRGKSPTKKKPPNTK